MSNTLIALTAGLSGMLGWGMSDFFAKKTIDRIGDLKTLIGSQIIGAFLLLVYFLITNFNIPPITVRAVFSVLLLSVLDATGYLFLYRSFKKGIVSVVSPIAASAAGITALISIFFFHEQLTRLGAAGLILIFLGIVVTSTDFKDLGGNLSKENFSKGIPEALGAMLLFGFWFAFWDRFVKGGDFLFWLILLKFLIGTMLVIYFYLTNRKKDLITDYAQVKKTLVWVGALDAIAYLGTTWGYSITVNTTSLITMLANAYSVPTIILAYLFFKERITRSQLLGISSIIVGIIINSVR